MELSHIHSALSQNNFDNKIPFIFFRKVYQGSVDDHGKNEDQDQKYHQNNDCSSSGYSLVPKKNKVKNLFSILITRVR